MTRAEAMATVGLAGCATPDLTNLTPTFTGGRSSGSFSVIGGLGGVSDVFSNCDFVPSAANEPRCASISVRFETAEVQPEPSHYVSHSKTVLISIRLMWEEYAARTSTSAAAT